MTKLFILTHEYLMRSGVDERKWIGTYSTRAKAEAALARVRDKPGFREGAAEFATLRSLISTAQKQGWNILDTLMHAPTQPLRTA